MLASSATSTASPAAADAAATAAARKARIKALEAERLSHVPKTALEMEEEAERTRLRAMAVHVREESEDDVKKMRMLQNYAITVSIRDRQLAEKKERAEQAALEERMRDLETEIARLETVKRVAERDTAARTTARVAARQVYTQLEERLAIKKAAAAALRAEGEAMVARIKASEAAYKEELERARIAKAAILADVLASNEESTRIKAARREADIAEDLRIEAVQREMDAKKMAEEEERERARKEREDALFKVRGEVERVTDTRAALDELRARRAFEAGQRAERARELERARKRAETLDDLRRARVEQLEAKQHRVAAEIEGDKAEFERAIRVQEEWLAAEREVTEAKEAANRAHVADLLRQKEEKEAAAKAAAAAARSEGDVAVAAEAAKQALLRRKRDEKVAELLALGVDERYTVQLARVDPAYAVTKDYMLGAKGAARGGRAAAAGAAGAGAGAAK